MSDKSNFNKLMATVFKKHWKPVSEDEDSNNFIGALSHDDFKFFQSQFMGMIYELYSIYENNPQEIDNLVKTVKKLATKSSGCYGAYSELCALHVLNHENDLTISTDLTLPATESFAANLGHAQNTNMDGCFRDFEIYFDTKSFQDTITSILKNISSKSIQRLVNEGGMTKKQGKEVSIQYQFPHTDSEDRYNNNVKGLIDEFVSKFKGSNTKANHELDKIESDLIPELQYILNWGGVTSTESSYSPFERAEKLVEQIFVRYADKFLLNKPFMLVLVNHPWFNQVDTDTFDYNRILYRALSRRVFMQFRYNERKMSDINHNFTGDETIDEVSKHISAILYIDVFSAVDEKQPYKCYLYTNPRSVNNVHECVISHIFSANKWLVEMDDFKHDNY